MTVVVGLGGTLRAISYSRMALEVALAIAEEKGAETHLIDLRKVCLPMYNADAELNDYPEPKLIEDFIELHRRADVYIWSSPCYHGTVSGSFKNAVDFLEFMSDDERPYLTGRAVGVISVNDTPPIDHMRTIARELRAWCCPSSVVLTRHDFSNGVIHNEKVMRRMNRTVNELLDFANR